jgi:hypothetical protein
MTSIDRASFIRDLSTTRIAADRLEATFRSVGIEPAEAQRLSGDGVFYGEAEYGQLYDRLVELEGQAARTGGQGANLDRALAVYNAVRQPATPSAPAATASVPAASSRPRLTGLFTPSILAPPPLLPTSRADYVRAIGDASASQLRSAAERNITGPAAGARNRIIGQTDETERQVRDLERRIAAAPAGSRERRELEAQLEATVRVFENTLASESAMLQQQGGGGGGFYDQVRRALPRYLQQSIDREGLAIPGTPAAIRPRTSSPYGVEIIIK